MSNEPAGRPTDATVSEVLARLSTEGYPITVQRRALVQLVLSFSRRFTADDVLDELRGAGLKVGRATVFRSLDLLTRLGYLGRVHDGGHLAYTVCAGGHHHHLVCSNCGQVLHFEDCPITGLLSDLESRTGYQIEHHRVEVAGICPACQR